MPKLKNVGIIFGSLEIPRQSHKHLITFFNLQNDPNKLQQLLRDARFDLCGLIPSGFSFKSEDTIAKILTTFNESPDKRAFIVFPPALNNQCPYFINKTILTIGSPISDLNDMVAFVHSQNLEALIAKEEVFTYDH